MGEIKNILFDYDGTLMDTNRVIVESWQHTFREIEGRERMPDEIFVTFGEPLQVTMKRLFPDVALEESLKIYRSWQNEHFEGMISLFPGVKLMLEGLVQKGVKMALVTSRMSGTTRRGLRQFGIEEYFDVVVTADHCNRYKPDPEPINIACEKLGASKAETLMVGDTNFDLHCARNAGVMSAIVSWALAFEIQSHNHDGDYRPDYIIDRPESIFEII